MTLGRGLLVVASLVMVALPASWALGVSAPLWLPPLLLCAYLGLVVLGVLSPRLQMFGPAVCFVPGARGKLALTFDDGPDPSSTPLVLDALRAAGAQATFFLVGKKVEKYPQIAARVVREGHLVGAHSYEHDRLYAFFAADEVQRDIERTCATIEGATGVRPRWFRPPVGQMSPPTALGIRRSGLKVAGWSVRSLDGLAGTTVDTVKARVLPRLKSGAIVLLHDALERETPGAPPPAGVRALADVLSICRQRGLRCVSLDELLTEWTGSKHSGRGQRDDD